MLLLLLSFYQHNAMTFVCLSAHKFAATTIAKTTLVFGYVILVAITIVIQFCWYSNATINCKFTSTDLLSFRTLSLFSNEDNFLERYDEGDKND